MIGGKVLQEFRLIGEIVACLSCVVVDFVYLDLFAGGRWFIRWCAIFAGKSENAMILDLLFRFMYGKMVCENSRTEKVYHSTLRQQCRARHGRVSYHTIQTRSAIHILNYKVVAV